MKVIPIHSRSRKPSARAYIHNMLAENRITDEMIADAEIAFQYALQFKSPRRESELVRFISMNANAKASKAA